MSSSRAKGPFPLSELPNEIRQSVIYSYSTLKDLSFLAQTSKQYKAETTLSRLLSAAIHAVPRLLDAKEDENATALEAIDILKKHPELLFIKEQVKDHYGRDIFASPYQIFLGTCDIWALRQIQEDILPLITNEEAKAEAEAQFTEQFPRYLSWPLPQDFSEARLYDNRNELQIAEIKDQLAVVKDCIDGDPFNNNEPSDNTKAAVERLCNLFKPKPGEVIQSGLHFPLAIMREVYETYNALQKHWSFFSLNVIKPALDALSTVDGQCCQYGLRYLDMEKGPSRCCHPAFKHSLGQPLSLRFVNNKGQRAAAILVDPYDGDVFFVSSKVGFFDLHDKKGSLVGLWYPEWTKIEYPPFVGKFMENKNRSFGELFIMQPSAEMSTHSRNEHKRSRQCPCVIL